MIGYHGTTLQGWEAIEQSGVLMPTSRLDIFVDRNAARENLQVRPQFSDLVIPEFAYDPYIFFVDSPQAPERYYDLIPASARYEKARNFLRRFIDRRREVALQFEVDPKDVSVIDFYELVPGIAGILSPVKAWRNYFPTFRPFSEYEQETYVMPEFCTAQEIPLERVRRLW